MKVVKEEKESLKKKEDAEVRERLSGKEWFLKKKPDKESEDEEEEDDEAIEIDESLFEDIDLKDIDFD